MRLSAAVLRPGERHVQRISRKLRVRQRVFFFVACLCAPVQCSAARIRHAEHARHLVEALARRVVARGAENSEVRVATHIDNQRMPARNDQTDEWRLQLRIRQIVCRDMPADMVNRHQRQIQRIGRSLRKIHADQHRADEPRRIGDCDGVQVPARQAALLQAPDLPDHKLPQCACAMQSPAPRRRRACAAPPARRCSRSEFPVRRARWQPPFRRRRIRSIKYSCQTVLSEDARILLRMKIVVGALCPPAKSRSEA